VAEADLVGGGEQAAALFDGHQAVQDVDPGRDVLAAHCHLGGLEDRHAQRVRLGAEGRLAAKRDVLAAAHRRRR